MQEKAYTIAGWAVLVTLIFAIVRQLSERRDIYFLPDSWGQRYARHGQEGFMDASPAEFKAPYTLLADVLPEKKTQGTLTAESCYKTDFLAATERTGNYLQRTNNFRHETPDNCSAPRTELVDSIYSNPVLVST
jgi:hypothetical protein